LYGILEESEDDRFTVSARSRSSPGRCITKEALVGTSFGNEDTSMNRFPLPTTGSSYPRIGIFVLAGMTLIAGMLDLVFSRWILASSAVFFFLGVTDFGRQCPLFLSVQHHINRRRSKNK
jgi:hypothetical protein